MSEKPISRLRQRMIEDMAVRRFNEKTQSNYIRQVKNFTVFLGRSPDQATAEDLRRYQVHQSAAGVQPPTMNGMVAALRFFFTVTCGRPEMARHLTLVRQPRKQPVVLSQEEVGQLLEAAPGPKWKAALGVAYGAGLRVSEVATLKVRDIDSKRMLLRVDQGKGQKDRHGMLSPKLLQLLRDWWCVEKPTTWLFPGRDPLLPISTRQIYRVVCDTADAVEIKKRVSPHTLRHSSICLWEATKKPIYAGLARLRIDELKRQQVAVVSPPPRPAPSSPPVLPRSTDHNGGAGCPRRTQRFRCPILVLVDRERSRPTGPGPEHPGGSGAVAAAKFEGTAGDGYTLLFWASSASALLTMRSTPVATVAVQGNTVYGVVAPVGTPDSVVQRLNAAINNALAKSTDLKSALVKIGAEPKASTSRDAAVLIRSLK